MSTVARLRFVRISPQKLRLVADMVRGLNVADAIARLEYSTKKGAKILRKVIESAMANAENNDNADIDELRVTKLCVDQGPTLKRMRPRAKGRANTILKRSSHVSVEVSEI